VVAAGGGRGSAKGRRAFSFLFSERKPSVAGFTLLALVVALWGTAYRLSLYQNLRSHSSQIPFVKLWIEQHRDSSAVAAVAKSQVKPCVLPASPPLPVPPSMLLRLERERGVLLSGSAHGAATASALIPFRSPPSFHFLLT